MSITKINLNSKQVELITESYEYIRSVKSLIDRIGYPTTALTSKIQSAYDAYDDLVDKLVEVTAGNALAVDTDPLSYYRDKSKRFFGKTYNEMAEVMGQEAFGS